MFILAIAGTSLYFYCPEQPYSKETMFKLAESDPKEVFYYFPMYQRESYAAELLEKTARSAAKKMPGAAALRYAHLYIHEPYADEVIREAASGDPVRAVMYGYKYFDKPYAEEIIFDSAAKNPVGVLNEAYFFASDQDSGYEKRPLLDLLFKSARIFCLEEFLELKIGYLASDKIFFYRKQPYAEKVIEIATKAGLEKDPAGLLDKAFYWFKDKPYAKDVVLAAAPKAPPEALRAMEGWPTVPYAKEVLLLLAENDVRIALSHPEIYAGSSDIRGIMLGAANQFPLLALQVADRHADQPYAKDMIERAVRRLVIKDTEGIFRNAALFANEPYAKEILSVAIKQEPGLALYYLRYYLEPLKNQPYLAEVTKFAAYEAAKKEPQRVYAYFELFQDEPYAGEVLVLATKNLPQQELYGVVEAQYWYLGKPYEQKVLSVLAKRQPNLVVWENGSYRFRTR